MYDLQSGFQQSFSTDSCLIYSSDLILKNKIKGEYTVMVVIDLHKAFHRGSHNILVTKLSALGLDQIAIGIVIWLSIHIVFSFYQFSSVHFTSFAFLTFVLLGR